MKNLHITNELQIDLVNHGGNILENPTENSLPWNFQVGLEGINSSPRAALLQSELRKELLADCRFGTEKPVTKVYSVFDGKQFGPWAEIATNNQLFAGDLGPEVLYGRGICIALPPGQINDRPLKECLSVLGYRGEVLAMTDSTGLVVDFQVGCHIPQLQLYSFLLRRNRISSLTSFILGDGPLPEFTEKCSISCLVSPMHWPYVPPTSVINIPTELRQNLFMLPPVGIVVSSGNSMKEVRMRLKAALHQIENKNKGVQYRVDAHYCKGLKLSSTLYGKLLQSSEEC